MAASPPNVPARASGYEGGTRREWSRPPPGPRERSDSSLRCILRRGPHSRLNTGDGPRGTMETTTQPTPAAETAAPVPGPSFPEGTKLREYETIYLMKPDLGDEPVEKLKERLRSLIHRDGGKVIKFSIWGKKKTHFEMGKQNRAIYTHVLYLGPSKLVAEVERNLRMFDDVVRYQTIKLADETDASKPVEADTKLAGDADQVERPPREERGDRRDDFGGPDADKLDGDEPEDLA
jgi:small subunit ribosomal protein S6